MPKETVDEIVLEALGKAAALFMTQEVKGTEIVMPSEELKRISDEAVSEIHALLDPNKQVS